MLKLKILSLDLARKCGWAFSDGDYVDSGMKEFEKVPHDSPGMIYLQFGAWLDEMISKFNPEIISYEMPHLRGTYATTLLVGLVTKIHEVCAEVDGGIEHRQFHSGHIKAFATNKGNASKGEMVEMAKSIYPEIDIIDDNHADALHILALSQYELANRLIGEYDVTG